MGFLICATVDQLDLSTNSESVLSSEFFIACSLFILFKRFSAVHSGVGKSPF